jgi:hypothetical protein
MSDQVIPSSILSTLPPSDGRPRVFVCLHRSPGLIGALIRWQQRGGWSHASLWFPGRGIIESREFKGVRALVEFDAKPGERMEVFAVAGLTPEQEEQVFAFAQRQLGKRYDWPMVFGFVSRSSVEGHQSGGKWFCSELVFAALAAAGIKLLRATDAWEVSPGLLVRSPLLCPCLRGTSQNSGQTPGPQQRATVNSTLP